MILIINYQQQILKYFQINNSTIPNNIIKPIKSKVNIKTPQNQV
jgi:hypothetical protein